jgi:hypothetical protein
MTARSKRKRHRRPTVQRDLVDRLIRELRRSKVRPEVIPQAAAAFRIILNK